MSVTRSTVLVRRRLRQTGDDDAALPLEFVRRELVGRRRSSDVAELRTDQGTEKADDVIGSGGGILGDELLRGHDDLLHLGGGDKKCQRGILVPNHFRRKASGGLMFDVRPPLSLGSIRNY